MKLNRLLLVALFSVPAFGQGDFPEAPLPAILIPSGSFDDFEKVTNLSQMLSSSVIAEGRTNIQVVVDSKVSCPSEYTNLISNTNLFSISEQQLLIESALKYKSVTRDSPPTGAVFIGLDTSYVLLEPSAYKMRRYQYTNSGERVEILFETADNGVERTIGARFGTKTGDGYEVLFNRAFRQFKQSQLDGVWIDYEGDHCASLMRFVNGKAVGKWLLWNRTGSLYMEAEFKQPYDYIGHLNFGP